MKLLQIYEIVQVLTSLILLGCYSATLIWVKNGSRYPFVIFLIFMLVASNICSVFVVWFD